MRNIIVLIVIILAINSLCSAQKQTQRTADFAVAAGNGFSPAVSVNKLWGLGPKNKFSVGVGLRFTGLYGGQRDYITAPARLTSGKTGPQVLFVESILSNLDTLSLTQTAVGYINIPIYLQYSFSKKFEIGLNIDALGLGFGGKQSGRFSAKESKSLNNTIQSAKPTAFNLLLVSDNDLGSLNSEIYARYWINNKIGIRAGLSFQFVEYTTERLLTFENDRFRSKNLLPMFALSYKL